MHVLSQELGSLHSIGVEGNCPNHDCIRDHLKEKCFCECYGESLYKLFKRIPPAVKLPSPIDTSGRDVHILTCGPHLLVLGLLAIGDVPIKGVRPHS